MLNIQNEKCPNRTLQELKISLSNKEMSYQRLKNLPDETEIIADGGYTIKLNKEDEMKALTEKMNEVQEFEEFMKLFIDECKNCSDEFYLTGCGFGRIDCPVKQNSNK